MSAPHERSSAPRHSAIERIASMNLDGASDRQGGPSGSSYPGSHRGSVSGSPSGGSQRGGPSGSPNRSRSGSNVGGSQSGSHPKSGPGGFPMGTGVDPAFDPNDQKSSRTTILTETDLIGKRIDLPAEAFQIVSFAYVLSRRMLTRLSHRLPAPLPLPRDQASTPLENLSRYSSISLLSPVFPMVTFSNMM